MCRLRKYLAGFVLVGLFCALMPLTVWAEEIIEPKIAPVNPKFIEWFESRNEQNNTQEDQLGQSSGHEYPTGDIPDPVDTSELWKDPPRLKKNEVDKSNSLPSSYDIRSNMPPIRNQNPWGSCWAFASIGSLESNTIVHNISKDPDLSEMHLAYFVYGDKRPGKTFYNPNTNEDILDRGGNASMAMAFMSRMGTVNESELPYPSTRTYTAPTKNPENYKFSGIRLKEAYRLGVLSGDAITEIVKQLIMTEGSVKISFYAGSGATSGNGTSTNFYFDNKHGNSTNHAVTLVGWDDNLPRTSFDASMRPKHNGAWLVRNSWGTNWGMEGYFWMSYEQYIAEVTAFLADKEPGKLKHYGYDDLGETGGTSSTTAANIFLAEGNELLKYVGFYTRANNTSYNIKIYDLGTDISHPQTLTSGGETYYNTPVNGSLIANITGYSPYTGYHTEKVNLMLKASNYFSVIVKLNGSATYPTAMEQSQYNPNVIVNGNSYFSVTNGDTYWRRRTDADACIKAFTLSEIDINESNFPDENFRAYIKTFDKDNDGVLTFGEIAAVKTISVANKNITSLKGIEFFTSLQTLDCSNNRIMYLDLSSTPNITAKISPQNVSVILKASKQSNGTYQVSLKDYGLDPSKVKSVTGAASYNNTTGIVTLSSIPSGLTYTYDTGLNGTNYMQVTLTAANPVIAAAELPDGVVGKGYSAKLEATGTSGITWTSQTLPAWLTLNANGTLTGTPEKGTEYTSTYKFTVTATNANGSDSREVSITVYTLPEIASPDIKAGGKGQSYDLQFTATGSTPITWAITGGEVPGLTLSGDTLSGTLTESGDFTFTVEARNNAGAVSRDFTVSVYVMPEITTTQSDIPYGAIGAAYSVTFKASGSEPFTWALGENNLPATLTLNTSTGEISGTPTGKGKYTFRLSVKNILSVDVAGKETFSIEILEPVAISTKTLPSGATGRDYSVTLEAEGSAPITWALSGDKGLPGGLSLDKDTGIISGKPETAGDYTFTVAASNPVSSAAETFALHIRDQINIITDATLEHGIIGKAYSLQLKATSSTPITWELSGDSKLPDGLELEGDTIKGTPSKAGSYSFGIRAANANSTDYRMFSMTVYELPEITTASTLPDGITGTAYTTELAATGTATITWTLEGGAMPDGLTLFSNGTISGIPLEGGDFSFMVKASNAGGSASRTFTIHIYRKPVIIEQTPATAYAGKEYKLELKAEGDGVCEWTLEDGELPEGLTLDPSGIISGKPKESGEFTFTLKVANEFGSEIKTYTIFIDVIDEELPYAVAGKYYEVILSFDIEDTDFVFYELLDGELPKGLSFDEDTAAIYGTPEEEGSFKFTIMAEVEGNDYDYDVKEFLLTVKTIIAPSITTEHLTKAVEGTSYSESLRATGTAPIVWSAESVPAGLRLDNSGRLYGTPSEAGNFTIRVTAANEAGSDTKSFVLEVAEKSADSNDISGDDDEDGKEDKGDTTPKEETVNSIRNLFGVGSDDVVVDLDDNPESAGVYVNNNVSAPSSWNVETQGVIAAVLPEIRVEVAGIYFKSISFTQIVPAGSWLSWHPFGNNSNNAMISDSEDTNDYTFLDDDGNEIEQPTTKPLDHVTVAAYFKANTLYSPVISASDEDPSINGNDIGSSSGGGGGGCNFGVGTLALMALAFMFRRR